VRGRFAFSPHTDRVLTSLLRCRYTYGGGHTERLESLHEIIYVETVSEFLD
jgi:hypothetical protein